MSDQYWDIHPSNSNYGEIIVNSSSAQKSNMLENISFVKYNFSSNIFDLTILKNNPKHATKHYQFVQLTGDVGATSNVFVRSTNGVLILEYEDGEILYFVRAGKPIWPDVQTLHDTFRNYKHNSLQEYGVHHQYCYNCGGSGSVTKTVQNDTKDREAVGSAYGQTVYEYVYHTHIETHVCNICQGKGWFYESDGPPDGK